MRKISSEWKDLADGLIRAEELAAQFRAEWSPPIETAHRKYEEITRQKRKERGQAAIITACILTIPLFMMSLVLSLIFTPFSTIVFAVLILTVTVPAIFALYGVLNLIHSPDPAPNLADLSLEWWKIVSANFHAANDCTQGLEAKDYGDIGEESFISHLDATLPDEYIAVRNLKVAQKLDADLIIIGSNGVWVFEVKHWSGVVTCKNGRWRHLQPYRESERRVDWPLDKQWIKEAEMVRRVLGSKVPRHTDLHEALGGGLVFTHEGLSLYVDDSCKARIFTPKSCVEALLSAPTAPDFTLEKRMQVADTLLASSEQWRTQRPEATAQTASATELSNLLYENALLQAASYISVVDKS